MPRTLTPIPTLSAKAAYRRQASAYRGWRRQVQAIYMTAEAAPIDTYHRERAQAAAEIAKLLPVRAPRGFAERMHAYQDPLRAVIFERDEAVRAARGVRMPDPLNGEWGRARAQYRHEQARERHAAALRRLARRVPLPDARPAALERAA